MYALPSAKEEWDESHDIRGDLVAGRGCDTAAVGPLNQGSYPRSLAIGRPRESCWDLSVAVNGKNSDHGGQRIGGIQSNTIFTGIISSGGEKLKLDPAKRELLAEDLARSKELIEERLRKDAGTGLALGEV